MTERDRDDDEMRLAQFETLIEATAPAPADLRCTCNRCVAARLPRGRVA